MEVNFGLKLLADICWQGRQSAWNHAFLSFAFAKRRLSFLDSCFWNNPKRALQREKGWYPTSETNVIQEVRYLEERVILYCDLNHFYALVELLSRPALRHMPLAVCGSAQKGWRAWWEISNKNMGGACWREPPFYSKNQSFSLPCVMKAVSVEAKDTIGGREVQKKTHPVVLEKSFTLFSGKIAKIYKIFDWQNRIFRVS